MTRRYDLSRRRCAWKLSVPDKERKRLRSAVDSVDTWFISWLRTRVVRCASVGVIKGRASGNASINVSIGCRYVELLFAETKIAPGSRSNS